MQGRKSIGNGRSCRNFQRVWGALTDCRRGASSCSSQNPYPSADWGSAAHSRARNMRRSHDLQTFRSASFLSSSCGIIVLSFAKNKRKSAQTFRVFHKKPSIYLCKVRRLPQVTVHLREPAVFLDFFTARPQARSRRSSETGPAPPRPAFRRRPRWVRRAGSRRRAMPGCGPGTGLPE